MRMASDPESKKKWDKANTTPLLIKFQNKTEQDIIDYLASESTEKGTTKQTIIKAALREYMKNHKEEKEMKYTVKSEYIDRWFGSASTDEIEEAQEKGFTAEDINRLARDWGVSAEDLMEQVEEA